MVVSIGRRGWLGVARELVAGTPVQPAKYLPYDTCTLNNTVTVLDDEQAKGIRERAWGSIAQKEAGSGDISLTLDVINAPYLLIPALGTWTSSASADSGVYVHTITRKDANPPTTLTVVFYNTVEARKFSYCTVNELDLDFSDGWVTAKASILSKMPTTGTGTDAIVTTNVLAYKDANIYFGATLTAALAAYVAGTGAVKLSAFTLSLKNNAEAHYLSGSNSPDHIAMGQFEGGGKYTLFFENTTERAAHEAQTQRAMVVSIKGGAIGATSTEEFLIKIPKFHITQRSVDTTPAKFVTENPTFVTDYSSSDGFSVQIKITNTTASY